MTETAAFDAEAFLKTLPRKPGVYRMFDAEGSVLYVGKARGLKARVTSYFRASGLSAKTMALVARTASVEITVTTSETEALLLEQSLIKAERPPYNIVLRDDKSYPFIHLTEHKDYPRLSFHRGAKKAPGRYFGPFPSAGAVRDSLNILQRLFQIRPCEDGYFKNRSRPCLQYQIQRCSGPCVGMIEPEAYKEDVRLAELFLEGKSQDVLDAFKEKMEQAANDQAYERAARYRDQITHLRRVQENQYVHGSGGNTDIFAVALGSGWGCVQGLFVRDGRLLGHRTWFPKNELAQDEGGVLNAFLSQYYFGTGQRDLPKAVVTSHALDDAALLAEALTELAAKRVEVVDQVRGQRARWVSMGLENAALALESFQSDRKNVYARFVDLQQALDLEDVPQRLECFDISHSSGEATVASCVVFDTNGPLKSDYRRFNIEDITPGDDYAAMEQALRRRYTRLKQGEAALPSLLIIDGGPGQMGRAEAVLSELQVEEVPILGIAKGPSRKAGLEKIVLGDLEVAISPNGGAMHLLQHIRDEAHRFAITGHRGRRQKQRRRSELDDLQGIGPKRKRELLSHFGSVAGVKGASIEEMLKVPGISRKMAESVYASFHGD